jgi:hypothetical protein
MKTYRGGCHCGAVRFEVRTDLHDISECNCSVCAKKGFVHLIVPPEQFTLLTPPDALATLAIAPFDGRNWEASMQARPR